MEFILFLRASDERKGCSGCGEFEWVRVESKEKVGLRWERMKNVWLRWERREKVRWVRESEQQADAVRDAK